MGVAEFFFLNILTTPQNNWIKKIIWLRYFNDFRGERYIKKFLVHLRGLRESREGCPHISRIEGTHRKRRLEILKDPPRTNGV